MMADEPDSGGEPELFAECTSCGKVYSAQTEDDGRLRPIGVEEGCDCGNNEFEPIPD